MTAVDTVGSIVCVLQSDDIEPKLRCIYALECHCGVVVWVTKQMQDRLWNSNLSVTLELVVDLQDHSSTIEGVGRRGGGKCLAVSGRYGQLRMKSLLWFAYVLQDIKYGCKDVILGQEDLDIMICSDHETEPWIVGVKPTVVPLKPNDSCGRVHRRDFHETTGISQATILRVVFEACRHVFLTMHLTRTHSVVYMKIFDLIERRM